MVWDPLGTIGRTYWIGGGQWAGKSTVARILAGRHGLVAYHHDYATNHPHQDRIQAAAARDGGPVREFDPEWAFVARAPEVLATEVIEEFAARFDWALDDLRALWTDRAVIAEGWGLRPESVAGIGAADRMVVLVPTEDFRRHQLATLPRAGRLGHDVSDPERAQRHRLERDRLVAADAVRAAQRLGIAVLEVDGDRDAEAVADEVGRRLGLSQTAPT